MAWCVPAALRARSTIATRTRSRTGWRRGTELGYNRVRAVHTTLPKAQSQSLRCLCRVDMGTADELGIDILINCLHNVSADYLGIKQLSIGGADEDWPVPPEFSPEVCSHQRAHHISAVSRLRSQGNMCVPGVFAVWCAILKLLQQVHAGSLSRAARHQAIWPFVQMAVQPIRSDPDEMVQTEEEYWEERQIELEDRIDDIRKNHPEKFKKLQELQKKYEESPEGRIYHAQDYKRELEAEEEEAAREGKLGSQLYPDSVPDGIASPGQGFSNRRDSMKGFDNFDM